MFAISDEQRTEDDLRQPDISCEDEFDLTYNILLDEQLLEENDWISFNQTAQLLIIDQSKVVLEAGEDNEDIWRCHTLRVIGQTDIEDDILL